jgi:hypothetical protein
MAVAANRRYHRESEGATEFGLGAQGGRLEARDKDIAAKVAKHGWTAIGVDDHDPSFVHSVGLMYSIGHPEIIIVGLSGQGYPLLTALIKLIGQGRSFGSPGKYEDALDDVPLGVRAVHPTQHEIYLGYAMAYCRHQGDIGKLSAVQVFWPDGNGRFPFDADCDPAVIAAQPRLDEPGAK